MKVPHTFLFFLRVSPVLARRARTRDALAYFPSPDEGLVAAHGTGGSTKKSKTSLFTNKTCLLTVLCRRDPA